MNEIITRQQAIARKLHKYFTGKHCKHGHLSDRYTVSGMCVRCCVEQAHAHKQRVKEAIGA